MTELGCHSTALGPDLNSVNPGSASAERKGARVARQRCAPGPTPGAVLCPAVRRGALQTVGRPAPASASGARGPPLLRAPLSSLPRPRPWPPANPEHRPTSSPRGCGGSWIGPPGACADTPPPPPRVVGARALVGSVPGCPPPRSPPLARSHSQLHLGTERLRGPSLRGGPGRPGTGSRHWIWGLRLVWLRPEGRRGNPAQEPGLREDPRRI